VPGGTAYIDNCNTCVGGDTGLIACVEDCAGEWGGSAVVDNCGTCDADPTNDCIQDCTGEWGGEAVVDDCGVCGGDNSTCSGEDKCSNLNYGRCRKNESCLWSWRDHTCVTNNNRVDCNGVAGGFAYIDDCNTCVGGDTGLQPCDDSCREKPKNLPHIRSIEGGGAQPGDYREIYGYSFGDNQGSSYVQFGSALAQVKSWGNNKIEFYIPDLPEGDYSVRVRVQCAQSNSKRIEIEL
ncbi:MAG: IPT/TIG domain-containing protein, partial [Desulfobulbaceae bacterium]|nr:IPT/TIG domain-containing protein [Desulfobulbaceae bacterium]